jgi:two-component system response regulator CpxR
MPNTASHYLRVLLIDGDVALTHVLREHLESAKYRVKIAHTGHEGSMLMAHGPYDIVLLDLMLPDANGLDVLKTLHAATRTPVIMFAAQSSEADRVMGLELGADDFLSKPFSPRELRARIFAVLRRGAVTLQQDNRSQYMHPPFVLNMAAGQTFVDETEIILTGAEQRLLELLLRGQGRIIPRSQLADYALGRSGDASRSLETHISSLRRKFLALSSKHELLIRSVRGRGYVLSIKCLA